MHRLYNVGVVADLTDFVTTTVGVSQGCFILPQLFDILLELAMLNSIHGITIEALLNPANHSYQRHPMKFNTLQTKNLQIAKTYIHSLHPDSIEWLHRFHVTQDRYGYCNFDYLQGISAATVTGATVQTV